MRSGDLVNSTFSGGRIRDISALPLTTHQNGFDPMPPTDLMLDLSTIWDLTVFIHRRNMGVIIADPRKGAIIFSLNSK